MNLNFAKPSPYRFSLAVGLLGALAVVAPAQTVPGRLTVLPAMDAPEAVHRAALVGRLAATTPLHLAVSLTPRDPAALQAYADRVSDPKSPDFHRFLTPAEVGRRFGATSSQVQSVSNYLRAQGMRITLVAQNGLSILAESTAAQAERAFDTTLAKYHAVARRPTDRPDFFAYTETPKLPAAVVDGVLDIGGLENSTRPVPRSLNASQTRAVYKSASYYSGNLRGQGRNLAISNFDGYRLSNVAPYYSYNSLPSPPGGVGSNVKVVVCGTAAGAGKPQGEGDLDIQMVLGVAPLCNFTIYDGTDLIGVLAREVDDNVADVISESYGWQLPASTATAAHNLHLSMTAQGITYMAASGDSGTNMEPYSYPDYEPEALQVGGTIATADASGNRTSEVGWNGSGGGYSTNAAAFNALPSWQKGTGVPTNLNKRLVPDVALNAAGANGAYPFYLNGSLNNGYVGTSFAAPILAGLIGVAEQKLDALGYFGTGAKRLGRVQNLIYAQNGRSDVWTDVVSGANGNLPNGTASAARAGWDTVTGWGAINVEGFVAAVAGGAASPLPPVPTPTTFAPTGVSVFSAQGAAPSGSAASLSAVDGAFYAINSVYLSGVGNVATVAASFTLPTTATNGTVTVVATAPSGSSFQLFAYNVKTGAYDYVGGGTYTGANATYAVSLPSLGSYLSSTGAVKLVERSIKNSGAYVLKTDRFVVTAK